MLVCNIDSYFKFKLLEISPLTYKVKPLEKVGNHIIFNEIFNRDIVVKEIASCALSLPKQQFIFTLEVGGRLMPLCELSWKKDIDHPYLQSSATGLDFSCSGLLGYGKFYNNIPCVILYKMNPRDLNFEVFICNRDGMTPERLYAKFISGKFRPEINRLVYNWPTDPSAFEQLVSDFESAKHKYDKVPYINQKPYNASL